MNCGYYVQGVPERGRKQQNIYLGGPVAMQLPDHVVARLRHLACLYPLTRVQFRLPDASDFFLELSPEPNAGGTISQRVMSRFGHVQNPALTLEMAKGTLNAIWEGRLSARHAFLLGEIRFFGDRELAASLADLFPATSTEKDIATNNK